MIRLYCDLLGIMMIIRSTSPSPTARTPRSISPTPLTIMGDQHSSRGFAASLIDPASLGFSLEDLDRINDAMPGQGPITNSPQGPPPAPSTSRAHAPPPAAPPALPACEGPEKNKEMASLLRDLRSLFLQLPEPLDKRIIKKLEDITELAGIHFKFFTRVYLKTLSLFGDDWYQLRDVAAEACLQPFPSLYYYLQGLNSGYQIAMGKNAAKYLTDISCLRDSTVQCMEHLERQQGAFEESLEHLSVQWRQLAESGTQLQETIETITLRFGDLPARPSGPRSKPAPSNSSGSNTEHYEEANVDITQPGDYYGTPGHLHVEGNRYEFQPSGTLGARLQAVQRMRIPPTVQLRLLKLDSTELASRLTEDYVQRINALNKSQIISSIITLTKEIGERPNQWKRITTR